MAILGQSSLGTMRLNAARLNYHNATPYVTIGGTDRSSKVRIEHAQVRQSLSNTPDTCTLRVSGFTPSAGQEVKLFVGSTATTELLFAGTVQRVNQVYESLQQNVAYDLECVDYQWLLDRRLVTKSYVNQSATTIAKDLISTFTSGFTSANVQPGLSAVSVSFATTPVSAALTQLAQLVGARWKLTPTKDVRFYVPPGGMVTNFPTPDTLTASTVTDDHPLEALTDLAQVRTRVYVTGGTSNTSVSTAAHVGALAPVIPVTAAYPFGTGSGTAQVSTVVAQSTPTAPTVTQTDTIAFSGTSRSRLVTAPSVTGITVSFATSSGNLTTTGAYQWAFTYVTSNGETGLSPRISSYANGGNTATFTIPSNGALYTATANAGGTTVAPPDPSITAINVYRTLANGQQLYYAFQMTASSTNWPTTQTDTAADSALGTVPPATASQGIVAGTSATTTSAGASIGATSITGIGNCTVFDSAGGYAVAGDQIIAYSGYTIPGSGGNNIAGTLNVTALTSLVASGATITAVPALTGCTCTTNSVTPTPPTWGGAVGSVAGPSVGTAYSWVTTFVTAAGESLPSAASFPYTIPTTPSGVTGANSGAGSGPTNTGVYAYIVAIQTPSGILSNVSAASGNFTSNGTRGSISATVPSGTLAANVTVFRTQAGGGTFFLLSTLVSPTVVGTTFTAQDGNTDASLTTTMTSYWVQKYNLYQIPTGPSSVTSRKVYRTNSSGTYGLLTTIADNTTTTFTDSTADGSLGAAPPTVDAAGATGVPAIPSGTALTLFVQVDDTAAQSTLAGLEGGDGIHEDVITNTTQATTAGMSTLGTAVLNLFKAEESKATFTATDYKLQPGATVSVSIGSPTNVSGSYIVEAVTTSRLGITGSSTHYVYPLKTVELGLTRFTLEDLLRRVALS